MKKNCIVYIKGERGYVRWWDFARGAKMPSGGPAYKTEEFVKVYS